MTTQPGWNLSVSHAKTNGTLALLFDEEFPKKDSSSVWNILNYLDLLKNGLERTPERDDRVSMKEFIEENFIMIYDGILFRQHISTDEHTKLYIELIRNPIFLKEFDTMVYEYAQKVRDAGIAEATAEADRTIKLAETNKANAIAKNNRDFEFVESYFVNFAKLPTESLC